MEELTFEEKVNAIKQDTNKTFKVTPWEMVNHFGYHRRSWYIVEKINQYLSENELELGGDLYHSWFYAEMVLRHKVVATTKVETDPIKRVDSLAAANHKPIFVDKNSKLSHAITLMQQYDYSQLPVVSSNERNICGHISWKSIGLALWHEKEGDKVGDYMVHDIAIISKNESLLNVVQLIAQREFAVVINEEKALSGIITASDVANEFFSITQAEAFLLLEQIELQIRSIIGQAGLLLEDLQAVCAEEGRIVNCVDDLTFGEYCRIIENPKYWKKLNIASEREDFVKFMEEIRKIRNNVMHFEPDGIGPEKMQTLRNMSRYLSEVSKVIY